MNRWNYSNRHLISTPGAWVSTFLALYVSSLPTFVIIQQWYHKNTAIATAPCMFTCGIVS
jgi:hypothetical protein